MSQINPKNEYEETGPKCYICDLPVLNMSRMNKRFMHTHCMFRSKLKKNKGKKNEKHSRILDE